MPRINMIRISCLLLLFAFTPLYAADGAGVSLTRFDKGLQWAWGSWKGKATTVPGGVRLTTKDNKGGGGGLVQGDFSAYTDYSPQLEIEVHAGNKAKTLRLQIADEDETKHQYTFILPDEPGPATLLPPGGASVEMPDQVADEGKTPGLAFEKIKVINLVGDYKNDPLDITLKAVELMKPTADILSARNTIKAKRTAALEEARKAEAERLARIEEMLAGKVEHQPDDPFVVNVAPVAPDILAIAIQEKTLERKVQIPYEAQEGDRVETDKKGKTKPIPAWREGKVVMESPGWQLRRGKDKYTISPDVKMLAGHVEAKGEFLNPETVGVPKAYRIVSTEHAAFAGEGAVPTRVSVKRKPNGYKSQTTRTDVYLRLPEPLVEGATYTVMFKGVNTREESYEYTHDSRTVRSELVHVSHIGFKPNDPRKTARLSIWFGPEGGYDPGAKGPIACALIDQDSDAVVWEGIAAVRLRGTEKSSLPKGRSLAHTDVYEVDFSAFSTPGQYRLWVKGIGCSYPFPIRDNVWEEAFKVSMQGLLSHRNGIALPRDLMGYERPRPMHPADGFKVLPLLRSGLSGESEVVRDDIVKMMESGNSMPSPLPDAWGGYMDAGDWDRNKNHFGVTAKLLELYESNPAYWQNLAMVLPASERENQLPDLLDEARWNLGFFLRLQTPPGGIRGGIESAAHPRPGEASWQESLVAGAFAPDPSSSFQFAAIAAQYARLARSYEPTYCTQLQEAAIKAYRWADSPDGTAVLDTLDGKKRKRIREALPRQKALASIHLLRLTKDPVWHSAILEALANNKRDLKDESLYFAYCLVPAELADQTVQETCKDHILALADKAIAFQKGNAWDIATPEPNLPPMGWVGYLSVPGMISLALPRAYMLSKDEKYLSAIIGSCSFSAGANPDNQAYTTGLGPNPVEWPLHVDSLISGQKAPKGITVYGPSEPAENYGFLGWVYQWYLNDKQATPDGRHWPMAESYFDIYTVPSMNEYTVHQTIVRSAYHWGFLAANER